MTKVLFALRKAVPELFMPFGLALILIALGLVFRRRRALVLAGLLLLLIAGLPVVADSLCLLLENQSPHLQAAQCPTADVVVALGGFAGEKKRFPREIEWYDAVDRFEAAVRLIRLEKAPIILLTPPNQLIDDWPNHVSELLRQAAVEHGVPAGSIRLTRPVSTTAEEAEAVRDFLRESGGHRVILVTSAIHLGRAAFLFRRAGIDFVPFPVDYQSDGWEWKLEKFVPSAGALALTEQSLHEIYGVVLYRLLPFGGPHAAASK